MTAIVEATLIISSAPVTRTGRRAGDPPDSPEREFAYATARAADDPTKFELFGLTPTARTAIGRVGIGDTVEIRGPIAARVAAGAAILQVNLLSIALRLPIKRRAKKAKPGSCARGTRLADPTGVAAAQSAWLARANRLGGSE